MAKSCSICTSTRVAEINAALLSAQSYRDVAGQFGTSKSTLERHRPHIARAIARAKTTAATKLEKNTEKQETALAIKEAVQVESVLDRLRAYHRTIQEILKAALESKDHAGALRAVSAGLKQLEIEGKLLGAINDNGSGTGVVVQVVYVNATGRTDNATQDGGQKQIVDV